jgi:catechol 2,3-dioxygenase-like lactoylglutathione lyase family enzyme
MTSETIPTAVRLHHHAWVTTDSEATRAFYEDIIGLPLVATWTEGSDGQQYCHTLYGLGDGGAIAFFQFADPEYSEQSAPPVAFSPYRHVALKVDTQTQAEIRERAESAGVDTFFQDHGFCKSLYINDPNALILEFTVDHPEVDKIDALSRASAHQELARWLTGDYSTNNEWHWDA